jgi:hypothetical protein
MGPELPDHILQVVQLDVVHTAGDGEEHVDVVGQHVDKRLFEGPPRSPPWRTRSPSRVKWMLYIA